MSDTTTTTTTTLWDRFLELPRAYQWAAYAAVGLMLFLLYSSQIQPRVISLNDEAARMIQTVQAANRDSELGRLDARTQTSVVAFGGVELPANREKSAVALHTTVTTIMADHGVSVFDWNGKAASRLKKGTIDGLADRRTAERISGDLRFAASPDDAMSIIASLEAAPDIESVSSVRIVKSLEGSRKVSVRLSVEAWALTKKR